MRNKLAKLFLTFVLCLAAVSLPVSAYADTEESGVKDGVYEMEITVEGLSDNMSVKSPVGVTVLNGKAKAVLEWDDKTYDYMIVDGKKHIMRQTIGDHSVFEVPVSAFDEPLTMTVNVNGMSAPKEVEFTITFHSDTSASKITSGIVVKIIVIAAIIAAAVVVLIIYGKLKEKKNSQGA